MYAKISLKRQLEGELRASLITDKNIKKYISETSFDYEVFEGTFDELYDAKPIGKKGIIYFVNPDSQSEGSTSKNEYIWVGDDSTGYYELIGSTSSLFIDENGNIDIKIDSNDAYINIPKDENKVVISSGSNTINVSDDINITGNTIIDGNIEVKNIGDESEPRTITLNGKEVLTTDHSDDEDIHVTKEDKERWNTYSASAIIDSVDNKTRFEVTNDGIDITTIDESEKVAAQCKLENITEPNIAGTLSDGTNTINVEAGPIYNDTKILGLPSGQASNNRADCGGFIFKTLSFADNEYINRIILKKDRISDDYSDYVAVLSESSISASDTLLDIADSNIIFNSTFTYVGRSNICIENSDKTCEFEFNNIRVKANKIYQLIFISTATLSPEEIDDKAKAAINNRDQRTIFRAGLTVGYNRNTLTYANDGSRLMGAYWTLEIFNIVTTRDKTIADLVTIINESENFSAIASVDQENNNDIILTAKIAGGAANKIVYNASGCFTDDTLIRQGTKTKGLPLNRIITVDNERVITEKDPILVELSMVLIELKKLIPNMQILSEFLSAMVIEDDSEEP